uniref:hypothetical protein n=1 Tax=Marinobacterium profundum TaxID=1714300 RepID=UPI0008372F9A|nr:hypothetical protein [Marinobacterium profundum]
MKNGKADRQPLIIEPGITIEVTATAEYPLAIITQRLDLLVDPMQLQPLAQAEIDSVLNSAMDSTCTNQVIPAFDIHNATIM